ncbi:MAG: hypothetical protein ACTSXP_15245 [Promethearchaeota archaeon]
MQLLAAYHSKNVFKKRAFGYFLTKDIFRSCSLQNNARYTMHVVIIFMLSFVCLFALIRVNPVRYSGASDNLNNPDGAKNFWSDISRAGAFNSNEIVWSLTWGGPDWDFGRSVLINDTYIYTCGSTESPVTWSKNLVLIKWDLDGTQIWNRTWGGSDDDYGNAICSDGTYVYTCGSTMSYGSGTQNLLLIKWDSAGTQIWNKT